MYVISLNIMGHCLLGLKGTLYFIGEDRVLAVSENIFIYRIPPLSRLVRNWDSEGEYQSGEDITLPMWTYSSIICLPSPSFTFDGVDSYRLVVQTLRSVVGIYIPLSPDQQPSVRFQIRRVPALPIGIGLYKGWMPRKDKPATRLGYDWDGNICASFTNAEGEGHHSFSQVLLDEETGRCILRKKCDVVEVVDFI